VFRRIPEYQSLRASHTGLVSIYSMLEVPKLAIGQLQTTDRISTVRYRQFEHFDVFQELRESQSLAASRTPVSYTLYFRRTKLAT
jgi:hypothetical protein